MQTPTPLDRINPTEATNATNALFERLFQHAPTGIVITDMQGTFELCNPAYRALLGYTEKELHTLRFSDTVHPDDREESFAQILRLRAGEIRDFLIENRYLRKDGKLLWARTFASYLRGERGQPTHIMVHLTDMTERKQAEIALRQSEARYRAAVETAGHGFWMLDGKGRILVTNDAYARRSGYSREQLLSMHITDLEVEEDAADVRRHMHHIRQFGSHTFETRHRAKDGTIWPLEVHVSYWENAGAHYCAFLHDTGERRALEREIIDASTAEQERIGRDIHEGLGQQLTGLSLLASAEEQHLRRAGDEQGADAVGGLRQHIQTALDQARALVRGLRPVEVTPEGLAHALADLATRVTTTSAVDCRYLGLPDLAVADEVVAMHLYRIAQEAAQNALKHSQATRIELDLRRAPQGIELSAWDNGRGLGPDVQQSHQIGLKIMRYRAKILGGKLSIGPGPKRGTLVRCEVPLRH